MLQNFFKHAILAPLHTYHSAHTHTTNTRRIQLPTTPMIVRTTAQRITAAIQKEPLITQPTLNGLILDCTKKQTADLRLHLKSLQDQLKAHRKPNNNTPRKSILKNDTLQKSIPKDDTLWKPQKNIRGSGNLIWIRKFPSRNTSNQAPADTQRFNQQPPKSTKQTHQQSQHPTNTLAPRFTPPPKGYN